MKKNFVIKALCLAASIFFVTACTAPNQTGSSVSDTISGYSSVQEEKEESNLVSAVSTAEPTATPTAKPTAKPTVKPTAKPTVKPTAKPTVKPTAKPTVKPTAKPTAKPAAKPTQKPQTGSNTYGTYYWTPGGKSYHSTANCTTLKRSKVIKSGTLDEAKAAGKYDPCNVCIR